MDIDITLHVTCQAVPVQIQGIIQGKHVYFRQRNRHWTFSIGDTEEETVSKSVRGRFGYTGKDPEAEADCPEFMHVEDALALTKALVNIYIINA